MSNAIRARQLLRRLAAVEPLEVPAGEPGSVLREASGGSRTCVPVLSVYLDLRPQAQGERPALRAARVILKERLHQIEQTFWPRGVAFDAVHTDAARIEEYLDSQASPAAQGVAIFASGPHALFEALEVDVPFDSQVSARAQPDLFQLARLLDDQETAVVAVTDTHAARLFVLHLGGLREVRGLQDDPKLYHLVRGANAMNQAHYQRHARHVRTQFAAEVADRMEQLVDRERARHVVLAGEVAAIGLLRQALAPRIAQLVHEPPLALDIEAPHDAVLEEVVPVLREAQAEQDRAVVERLVDAVRAGSLGIAGLEPTRDALRNGQAETLVLAGEGLVPPETRSELIELATRTDAAIEVVDSNAALQQLGGVGALLRYQIPMPTAGNGSSETIGSAAP
jgi:hypothetical protein